ncbi:MAG: PAS domain-containing protein, partial [Ferruginibacter sp.]
MNKLLEYQLQDIFGTEAAMPENLSQLLNVISGAYDQYESNGSMAEVKKDNKIMKALFENFDEVLYSINMVSSKLTEISIVCEKVFGYTATEFLTDDGLRQKLVHPDDRSIVALGTERLLQGQQVLNQYRIVHKDGGIRWIE